MARAAKRPPAGVSAGALLLAWGLLLAAAATPETPPPEPTGTSGERVPEPGSEAPLPEARLIAQRAEDVLRSDRTYLEARMTVVSPRLSAPRVVRFRSWDDRRGERSFIRILAPPKDAGSAFLKLPPNLWTYIPRVERVMRIPPSMMLQPWMGSDFTNDDLVNDSSDVDDYDHRLLGVEAEAPVSIGKETAAPQSAYVIEYVPHEDTPVVWGRIVGWIAVDHYTPLRQDFYDEDGSLVRTLRFGDVREVAGRHVPHLWLVRPLEKPGHSTRIEVETIRFDPPIDEEIFTTQHLKRRE